jgi:predicted permease
MSSLPSGGVDSTYVVVEGAPPKRVSELPNARLQIVSPSLLPTLKMKLLRGRWLSESDGPDTTPVVVISDLAARTLWPGQDPLGRRVRFSPDDKEPWRTVVGVVADMRSSPFNNPRRTMFQPYAQMTRPSFGVLIRTSNDPLLAATAARQALKEVDATIPAFDLRTLEQRLSDNTSGVHVSSQLMMAFGGIALLLAAAGIFAVMAYSVRQRTREIGIRLALGAQRADVLRLVLGYGARMVAVGMAIGLVISLAVTKLLTSFLLNIVHFDFLAMAAFTVLLAGVAAVAALIPARWATRVDPMVALRYE